MPRPSPFAQIIIAMLFIGTSGVLGRFVPLPPALAVWWRAAIGFVLLLAYCRYAGVKLRLNGRRQTALVALSGVLMALHWWTYFEALQRSSVAIGMLSIYTFPAMTTLLEPLLLGTRFQLRHLGLAVLVIVGVYLLAPSFSLADGATVGLIFGLVSALVYSLRNLLVKTQIDDVHGSAVMTWQTAVTVIVLAPAFLAYPQWPTAEAWPYLAGLGVLTTAIGHTLFLACFRYFSVSTVSILACVQPVYGIVLAMLFFREYPNGWAVLGGSLILAAVVVEAWATREVATSDA